MPFQPLSPSKTYVPGRVLSRRCLLLPGARVVQAPRLNPSRALITGVVCGIRVEEMDQSLMKEIRYLDKLIDELDRGKAMDKILPEG